MTSGSDFRPRGSALTDTTPPLSAPTAFQPADDSGYHRVLLKLSGETFGGGNVGVDADIVRGIAEQLAEVVAKGAAKAAKRGAEREATAGLVATSGLSLIHI